MKKSFTYKMVFWSMVGIIIIVAWMAMTVWVLNRADEIDNSFSNKEVTYTPKGILQYDTVWRGTVAEKTTVTNK